MRTTPDPRPFAIATGRQFELLQQTANKGSTSRSGYREASEDVCGCKTPIRASFLHSPLPMIPVRGQRRVTERDDV